MPTPLISVIIPVYQAEAYLRSCLDSCLQQSFKEYELVAVNDGSRDNSLQILKEYAAKDRRIKIIEQSNQGLVLARKVGIRNSIGEYLFFLDSDDTIPDNALALLYEDAQRSKADLIIGDISICREDQHLIRRTVNTLPYGNDMEEILCSILSKTLVASLCGRLIRKKCIADVSLPNDITIGEDFITNLFMCREGVTISLVNEILYNYVQHRSSMVNMGGKQVAIARMKFIQWVVDFVKPYTKNTLVNNTLALFVLEEYFSFLRDGGGGDKTGEIVKLVNREFLKNSWATRRLASWRLLMIRCYKYSVLLGCIYRFFFVQFRNFLRR